MIRTIGCTILLSISSVFGICQDWTSLDGGLLCSSGGIDIRQMVVANNRLIVTGIIWEDNDCTPMNAVAVWDGVQWDSLASPFAPQGTAIGVYRDSLYASAWIFPDPPLEINYVSRWDGTKWDTLVGSPHDPVKSMVEHNGVLYLGGGMRKCGNDSTYLLCSYDGTQFYGLTPTYSAGSSLEAIEFYNNELYVGGVFNLFPSQTLSQFAKWNGVDYESVDAQFENAGTGGFVTDLEVYDGELYVSGSFTKASGYTGDYIMKYDGTQFTEVGNGMNDRVLTLKAHNGHLYAAGWFTNAGGVESKHVAVWDGQEWASMNSDTIINWTGIRDLEVWNNELYLSGSFKVIGNDTVNGIAKYAHALPAPPTPDQDALLIYPNPANGSVNLQFDSSKDQEISIRLYNLQGQLIDIIADGMYGNQSVSIPYDVSRYSQGLYIVEMQAQDFSDTVKLMVVD